MGRFLISLAIATAVACPAARASAASIATYDNGLYAWAGSTVDDTGIMTGGFDEGPEDPWRTRAFLLFDLSRLSRATVLEASVRFYAGNGEYGSEEPTETIGLFDVVSDLDLLEGRVWPLTSEFYDDFGEGAFYGAAEVSGSDGDPMPRIDVPLSPAAIADITRASRSDDPRLGIGTALLSLEAGDQLTFQYLWSGPSGMLPAAELRVAYEGVIPVPPPVLLIASAIGGLVLIRRAAG